MMAAVSLDPELQLRLSRDCAEHEQTVAALIVAQREGALDAELAFRQCAMEMHQVKGVADRLFKGSSDLVLLEIDPARLSRSIVDENLEGGEQLFPHIYDALPVSAVKVVHAFPCEADGTFACRMI